MVYRKCKSDNPDCFNCPYDDCIATGDDISIQDAKERARQKKERDEDILKRYNSGVKIEDLTKLFGMSFSGIYQILKAYI